LGANGIKIFESLFAIFCSESNICGSDFILYFSLIFLSTSKDCAIYFSFFHSLLFVGPSPQAANYGGFHHKLPIQFFRSTEIGRRFREGGLEEDDQGG
jgi:hypothetical protein